MLAAAWLAAILAWSPLAAEAGDAGQGTLVVIVRHAEKAAEPADDPPLSATGQRRARRLAEMLADAGITGIYATQFRRTRQTAAPLAEARSLEVRVRPVTAAGIEAHADSLAAEVLADHAGGVVLVVGHSNTVGVLVKAFSGRTVEPMAESDYERIYLVRSRSPGHGEVLAAGYPPAAPD